MSYDSFIKNILESRENVRPEGVYMEYHHIIPDCMGGTRDKSNMIWLYPSEHYMAHKLLAEENPYNSKLQYAHWRMCHTKHDNYSPIKEDIDKARETWCFNITKAKYKKCICLETEVVYNSVKECAEALETTSKNISKVCLDSKRSWNGLHFDFYDESIHTSDYCKQEVTRRTERRKLAKVPSRERIEKLRLAKIGKARPDMSGANNPHARKVYCKELDKVFDCLADAGRFIGKRGQDIYAVCNGKQKTTGGYHFEYYKEEN